MVAFATVSIGDWPASTPTFTTLVNYVPSQIDAAGVAKWSDQATIFDARKTLSISVRPPAKGSQVTRVQVKLVHPVMDTVDTSLKIGECVANLDLILPKRATLAQRDLLLANLASFLFKNEVGEAVDNLESIY